MANSLCKWEWCDGTGHHDNTHSGILATVGTLEEECDLRVVVNDPDERYDQSGIEFYFDADWVVKFEDIEAEARDIENLGVVFARALRDFASGHPKEAS